jgi:hypothetical protein
LANLALFSRFCGIYELFRPTSVNGETQMLRNAWMLGLLVGAGLIALPAAAHADDILNLRYLRNFEAVPVYGASYAPYPGYGYYAGAPAYGYGYPITNYWGGTFGGYGYGGYYAAPAGYAPSYNWGFAAPYWGYGYGFGYSYRNLYFNYVYPTSPSYYAPTYYYQPSATWGVR